MKTIASIITSLALSCLLSSVCYAEPPLKLFVGPGIGIVLSNSSSDTLTDIRLMFVETGWFSDTKRTVNLGALKPMEEKTFPLDEWHTKTANVIYGYCQGYADACFWSVKKADEHVLTRDSYIVDLLGKKLVTEKGVIFDDTITISRGNLLGVNVLGTISISEGSGYYVTGLRFGVTGENNTTYVGTAITAYHDSGPIWNRKIDYSQCWIVGYRKQ